MNLCTVSETYCKSQGKLLLQGSVPSATSSSTITWHLTLFEDDTYLFSRHWRETNNRDTVQCSFIPEYENKTSPTLRFNTSSTNPDSIVLILDEYGDKSARPLFYITEIDLLMLLR